MKAVAMPLHAQTIKLSAHLSYLLKISLWLRIQLLLHELGKHVMQVTQLLCNVQWLPYGSNMAPQWPTATQLR